MYLDRRKPVRSDGHRWMVIAYLLSSLFFLTLIPLRMHSALTEPPDEPRTENALLPYPPLLVEMQTHVEQPTALSESEFATSLQRTVIEVDLYSDAVTGTDHFENYIGQLREQRKADAAALPAQKPRMLAATFPEPLKDWLSHRTDLAGLPIKMGDACRLSPDDARSLKHVSEQFERLRQVSRPHARACCAPPPELGRAEATFDQRVGEDPQKFLDQLRNRFRDRAAIPGLIQVMQNCGVPARLAVVVWLAGIPTPESSAALAGRAVFDPSPDVRRASIDVLKLRDPKEYRSVLIDALRYVWHPAAQHAAVALVAVNDQDAEPELRDLAYDPNPLTPRRHEDGSWSVRELSRVNHLRNCLLCHPPSMGERSDFANEDRIQGAVPSPGKRVLAGSYGRRSSAEAIRADITYLRPDFSVRHDVAESAPWPAQQRFDYFVRTRRISEAEARRLQRQYRSHDYPQRRSVLFALQQLNAQRWDRVIATRDWKH